MRVTCAGCKHLAQKKTGIGGVIHYCESTQGVVPHQWKSSVAEGWEATFWRIPFSCPLPDTEVLKSEAKAPESEWVTIKSEVA